MNIKSILKITSIALISTISSFAKVDAGKMVITWKNGEVTSKTVKLTKVNEKTNRLKFMVKDLPRWQWEKVRHIDFILDDACATKGEKGYWVMSEGICGSFKADNGFYECKRNQMPVYGVKKGDEAFVGIVKGLKYEYSTIVDVKDCTYKIYPRFNIEAIGSTPYEDIVIDYTYFKGKKANYVSMGKAYRKYQLERGEVLPLKERVKGNPKLKYATEAPFLKFHMANYMYGSSNGFFWDEVDADNIPKIRDFDNMMGVLKKLKDLGIDKADIILTNWNIKSNGRCPIYGFAEPELGGNKKCKELTAYAKQMGYQISPHILQTENYTISPAFNKDDLALQLDGGYIHYEGLGGEAYRPCFRQAYYKQVLENYTNMERLGFNGLLHIDVTSAIVPYPCFNLAHPCTRQDCAFYMNQIGKLTRALFGGFTSESGFDHVANTLDYALYVCSWNDMVLKTHIPLADRVVPLWQVVYHGIIMSTPYFSTIGYNTDCVSPETSWVMARSDKSQAERRLKNIEFGGRLAYYGSLTNDAVFPKVAEAYKEYKQLAYLQLEFMENHKEIAPNVFLTVYSDGSKTVVNYNKSDYNYKGETIKALDFKLYKPTAQK